MAPKAKKGAVKPPGSDRKAVHFDKVPADVSQKNRESLRRAKDGPLGAYAYAKEAKTTAVTPLNKKNVRGLIEKLFQDDPIYQPTVNRLKEIVHLEEAKGKKTPTPAKKAATPARKTPGAGKADPAPASEAKKKGGKPPGPAPALAATKKRRRAASPIADANKEPAEEPAPQPVAKKARGAKGAAPAPAPAARGKRAAAPAPPSPARGAGAGSLRKSRRTPVKSSKAREQRDAERTVERILVEEEAERAAAAAAALKKAARTGTKKGGPGAGAVTPARRGVKLEEELGKARRRPGRPRKGEEQKLKTKGAAAGLKKTPASTMRQQRLLTRSVPRSSRGRAIRKRDLGEDFVDVESGESEQEE